MDQLTVVFILITLTLLCALHLLLRRSRGGRRLPPGPAPLLVIGNLLELGDKPHRSLAHLAQIHGPIMSLKLGRVTTIVISSSALAQDVLQKQDRSFSSRFVPNALHAHNHYKFSVAWLPVPGRWRSLRKVMNSHIFSGKPLDASHHVRQRKVAELVAHARKCCREGVAMDVGRAAFRTMLNVLSNTLFSVDLADSERDEAQEFKDLVWNIMAEAGKPNLVDYFPALAVIDLQGIRRRMSAYFGKMLGLFSRMLDEKLETRSFQTNESVADVIDSLLNICQESSDEIDRKHIEHMCVDLFIAGTDTTSSTLEWAMTELLRNPEVMNKAKIELEQTIGKSKQVEDSDVSRLPYLQAIIKETLRMHSPVPFLIPRQVKEEIEVCGYTIPKGAQVLVNAWAIGRDSSNWESPTEFKPERFLKSKIEVRGLDFELIPFGAGRRICPGMSLAIRILPTMLGSLINSFDWKLEGGTKPEDLDIEEKFGITMQKSKPLRAVPMPM